MRFHSYPWIHAKNKKNLWFIKKTKMVFWVSFWWIWASSSDFELTGIFDKCQYNWVLNNHRPLPSCKELVYPNFYVLTIRHRSYLELILALLSHFWTNKNFWHKPVYRTFNFSCFSTLIKKPRENWINKCSWKNPKVSNRILHWPVLTLFWSSYRHVSREWEYSSTL